jgi:CDP-4-dehydro-6-deoxyglucose reductase/ferredoxin-NAD(P)+ reductase (naphthalene dioxygenase ferredoxin-specific)
MANSPNTSELEFHIKTLDGGEVSNYVKNSLQVGEIIKVKGPYGNAHLREKHKGPIIAVAGGTGLAPILSIIKHSQEIKMKQPINVYYGSQSEKELYFVEQFEKIEKINKNFNFFPVVIEESKNQTIRKGFVTEAVVQDIKNFDGYKAYLAGPPKMVEVAEDLLMSKGIRKVDIHSDAFYTPYDEIKE